jgi:hypothetical protein
VEVIVRATEIMASVRLTTAVVLICAAAMLAYAYATMHAREAYSYQWPAVAETRHYILTGLLLQTVGWSAIQWYWWVWQQATATHALAVSSMVSSWEVVVLPAHILVISGTALITAPAARSIFGERWPHILTALIAACATIGYILAAGGES